MSSLKGIQDMAFSFEWFMFLWAATAIFQGVLFGWMLLWNRFRIYIGMEGTEVSFNSGERTVCYIALIMWPILLTIGIGIGVVSICKETCTIINCVLTKIRTSRK